MAINFPAIDPVILNFGGPFAIRWYSLAYIVGIAGGWVYFKWLAQRQKLLIENKALDELLTWAIVGIVLGGRIGYVLFYNLEDYLSSPLEILKTWKGGMSFHGGLLGFVLSIYLFCRRFKLDPLKIGDLLACAAPIGICLGRIANFINAELYGRVTHMPWGMVFPGGGLEPRHPSQIYEAGLEGLLLFIILFLLVTKSAIAAQKGRLIGVFLGLYGIFRAGIEMFREPDSHIGLIGNYISMGQLLSIPMIVSGIILLCISRTKTL